MDKNPEVSIIIRAKDEEKWIASCLSNVFRQEFKNFEVILVDNNSTDRTVEKAKSFQVEKIVSINKFLPGKALNLGIRHSRGKYLVFLSAHCIPVNEKWLSKLLSNFDNEKTAGVYGRQEPMAFTEDVDKRDLINIFGLDKKVQKKDPFFHNANSVIRRDLWEKYPFSETANNIEDRIWAAEVLKNGFQIVYEPEASVYHYHGINQGRNIERARNVVRILEELHPSNSINDFEDNKVTVIIPVRSPVERIGSVSLLELAIESVQNSKYVDKIIVAGDNKDHLEIARSSGAETVMRPKELSYDYIELIKVYQYVLNSIYDEGNLPDLVFLAQERYPFRPFWLVDNMLERLINSDSDSVIAAQPVFNSLWRTDGSSLVRVDKGFMPTKYKEPVLKALYGLGCIMHSGLILQGKKIGDKLGLCIVDNPYSHIMVRTQEELRMAEILQHQWRNYLKKEDYCNSAEGY
jgi:GT2 family glycosyltransferase